jgi:hypothetical protein
VPESKFTIRFSAKLVGANTAETPVTVTLPAKINLPPGTPFIEGTINGFPFRAALKSKSKRGHSLELSKPLMKAADAALDETTTFEITRIGEEPEPRPPQELHNALAASPRAEAVWADITPIARRDWILWITSAKQPQTRQSRIEKACSMLASGKRRVCCFGGLNWLTKDHRSVDTWLPLPRRAKLYNFRKYASNLARSDGNTNPRSKTRPVEDNSGGSAGAGNSAATRRKNAS